MTCNHQWHDATSSTGPEWICAKCKALYSKIKDEPSVKREWVGLTDEEMKDALVSVDAETKRLPPGMRAFAQAIETKLKEKNT